MSRQVLEFVLASGRPGVLNHQKPRSRARDHLQDPAMPHSSNPFPNSRTILLPTAELEASPYFLPLVELENIAFNNVHVLGIEGKQFLPGTQGRFAYPEQFLEEMGPDGFCLLSIAEGGEIIGTISAKPFHVGPVSVQKHTHPNKMFKRTVGVENEEGVKGWELIASCVALRVKGKGLASWLMGESVKEIWKRSREAWKVEGKGQGKLKLYISTMQETNESYYVRRGFRTTNVIEVPPGVMESRDGFHIAEMVKELEDGKVD